MSADAFAALGDTVRAALSERGFDTPTEPQRRAIPPVARGDDALVVAPTGTGKTEAAMLPVFDAIVEENADGIGALYVTPLRALNRDMRGRLDWWADRLGVEVAVRHGDTTDYQRRQQAEAPPDVLITTPETVQAVLTGERMREALATVEHVVVDEVHELAASKRGTQLAVALERLRALAGAFQRVGLSATVGAPDEVGRFLTGNRGCRMVTVGVERRVEIEVRWPETTEADERLANELLTDPETASHARAIRDQVRDSDSTLVFVNTRQTAEVLGSRFREFDVDVGVHHGSLSKAARIDVEDAFKAGELDALLCTSSMELGIDVGRVDRVVQYGSPRTVSRLLQRVGRAGHRADRVSRGVVVSRGGEDTLEALAVARRARAGTVEPTDIHEGSLDVVANQVVGTVMDHGELPAREAYERVTDAYPFRDLSEERFKSVLREIADNRLLYLDEDEDRLAKSGGSWQYYYANLSMIPDEETYEVYDVAGGHTVGTLDERFVLTFAEPGATFIQRGEMWRVAEVNDEEGRVSVSPVEDPAGEVPSWTGARIPVPEAVAGEVGELRRVAATQLEDGATPETVARELAARYPADEATVTRAVDAVDRQLEADAPVPTDRRLLVEREGRTVVVNATVGHRINETVGRVLASLVGQRTGSSVGLEVDPYRIELEVPGGSSTADVVDVLEETDPEHVGPLIEVALKQSEGLAFTLSEVAETFGALKRWRGDGVSPSRLAAALEDTPVYEEAVRTVFHEELDVEGAGRLLERLQSGDIGVEVVGQRTPIGAAGTASGQDLLAPADADAGVVETVRERIAEDDIRLVCVHCTEFDRTKPVKRVDEQPECPRCGSTRIAALSPWADETVAALNAPDPDDETEHLVERAHRNASLVQGHGRKAVVALSGRGVGPENAARIINRHRESEAEFYRDILEREREYARTQAFWD